MTPEHIEQRAHKNRLLKHIKTLTRLQVEREEALKVAPVSHHSFILSEISALKAGIYSIHQMRAGIVLPRLDGNEQA